MPSKVKLRAKITVPADEEQLSVLRENKFTPDSATPATKELITFLCSMAGFAACLDGTDIETHYDKKIMKDGQLWRGYNSISMKGERSNCHSNTCGLYLHNKDKIRVVSGYALSRDGIWRGHSWGVTKRNIPVETTTKRVLYFGVVLEGRERNKFIVDNYDFALDL